MSNCIASELLKKGKTVIYQTAPVLLETVIDYKMNKQKNPQDNFYKSVLEADLLIIDDLGTESLNSMKLSELFTIINTRILNLNNKITKTIISTNLNINEIKNKNIKNSKIAIICDKSDFMVAGLLGILKSGNAYIPIDPSYPQKRIDYILNDSLSKIILTTKKYINKYNANHIIILDDIDYSKEIKNINNSSCDDLAYIIYTSGTTGNPKGVTIRHKNIVNTLIWRKNLYNFDINDKILQIPSFSFDSSVEDIFTTLISGAELIIPAISKMDVNIIGNELENNNITHFLVVPSLYKVLLKEKLNALKSLRVITIAGEGFSISLIKEHFSKLPNVRIINEYGPTENTIASTAYLHLDVETSNVIGKPIDHIQAYVVGADNKILAEHITGELYLSGIALARGYLNNPELTNSKFLPNPNVPGEIWYKVT